GDGGNVWTLVTGPTNGSVVVNADGTYTYTPNANFNGNDAFVYQLCDADNDCDTAIVRITINPVNDLPLAIWDAVTTDEDAPVNGTVASNDILSGDGGNVWTLVTGPTNGSVVVNADGTYTYTPNANYNGSDSFIYQLCDVDNDCDTAIVRITINSVNDLPTAEKDFTSTIENTPILVSVLTNDDFGGDGPVAGPITIISQGSKGVAVIDNGGTPNDPTDDKVLYTPSNGVNGLDTLIYQICDLNNDCDTALLVVNITPSNMAVNCNLISNESCFGSANGSVSVNVSGGIAPYTYEWSNGANTATIGGLVTGNYTVIVRDAMLVARTCSVAVSSPAPILITVNNLTNISCNGLTNGSIDLSISGGNNLSYTYEWTKLGGGFSAITQDVNALSAGTYFVAVTDASGCKSFDTLSVTEPPILSLTLGVKANLACDDVFSGYIDVNVSGGNAPYSYSWTKTGDILFSETTQDIFQLGIGTYNLLLTDALGCTKTLAETISSGSVQALFTATQLDCEGNYQLVNNSVGADDYVWDIEGISPAGLKRSVYCTTSDTTFIYNFIPGSYKITLTANSNEGCVDSMTTILNITVKPLAVFTYAAVSCSNQINFTNLTVNGVTSSWNFGDPASGLNNVSLVANPSHVFTSGGIYPVTLIATDGAGCGDTLTRNIPVTPLGSAPIANFTSQIVSGTCVTKVYFTNTSSNASSYVWVFPDGSLNNMESPSKTFPLAGTYTIKLIAVSASGCTDTIEHNVVINSNTYGAVAKFVANDTVQCFTNNRFNFINQSLYYGPGYIADYIWDFGDGNTNSTNTFVYDKQYAAPGVYNVQLIGISPSGCMDTAYQTIRVKPSADPRFVMTIGCGKTAILTHDIDTNVTYVWNFGDGNFASHQLDSFTHTFANPGLYNISLTTYLENGCSDSYSIGTLASDGRTPIANFSYYQACGNNIQFNNLSQWGSSFLWNFGDGTPIDSSYAPYHSFPAAGTYNVTLTVYSSPTCIHTITLPVLAPKGWNIKLPRAKMAYYVQPCTNIIVARDSLSIDATNFKWYLNSAYVGSGSSINIPTTTAGIYELMMIADNVYCSDTVIAGIHIQDAPEALFEVITNSCSNTIMVASTSKNANTFEWNFGELSSPYNTKFGSVASHTYSSNGTFNVRLIAYNMAGCADTLVIPVTVTNANSMNLANFTYNNGLCDCKCQNLVRFKNLTPGNNVYLWSFGDGSTSVMPNPSKGYPAAGTYQVTLTSVDNTGCMSTRTKTVEIDPSVNGPSASFSTDHQVQCVDSNSFNFYNSSTYMGQGWINKYYWYFGDGTMDSSNTFVYNKKYASAGNYIVTLVAVGAEGCRDTMSMYVQVRALPCTGTLKFVNLQDGSNWNIDPKLGDGGVLNSVQTIDKQILYSLYPNPNTGSFGIQFNNVLIEPITITVLDVLGKQVYQKIHNQAGKNILEIDIENLNDGTYMLLVTSDSKQYRDQKFVVIH
ncbi:MAG: PKD domain-containing protein, partial [Bacteroidota bacterium]|nr:PKD domain-containing protein [Bacteroidota bacterium]